MASKSTLSIENLERLGTARLAELLMEISQGDAATQRFLRLALAEAANPEELGPLVRKRLRELSRSQTWVDGAKQKALQQDLDSLRRTIAEKIAGHSPSDALSLLWQFLALAPSVYERCDDSHGGIGEIFAEARDDMSAIAQAAKPDASALAAQIYASLNDNGYGQYDGLIGMFSESLGAAGLDRLKSLFDARLADRSLSDWQRSTSRYALQDIADAMGDADAFAAQYDSETQTVPANAARVAERFLNAGRPEDAMTALGAARIDAGTHLTADWDRVRINTLDALGQTEEAQLARWNVFERSLAPDHLRAFLERLPDFEDQEAEDRAMAHARQFGNVHAALHFLLVWPALGQIAKLIEARWEELDGNYYELLSPAVDVLEADYPLATTLACRVLIDHTLNKAKSTRYRHAARHLSTCKRLASSLTSQASIQDHEAYVEMLRARHGRKPAFWSLVE